MDFTNGQELLALCEEQEGSISQIMQKRENFLFPAQVEFSDEKLEKAYHVMKDAAKAAIIQPRVSMGELLGGEAQKLFTHLKSSLCGNLISKAVMYAMGTLEVNTSMGLIVAAPTAGASGVLPGVLLSLEEEKNIEKKVILNGLRNASAIGYLIARNASVSGAQGGCQAEVGSASAMAASAIVEILGGSPADCLSAAATALMNIMGLICDPIGGLVEVPCQKRNAMGVSNAFVSAEITLAGISSIIPFDEVVEAMKQVGDHLPYQYKETALGGVAISPTACQLKKSGRCVTTRID
ncbi:putative L-serine dehydratase, alpha chain [Clostridia bacterium]|nr:putative L-serine dehydratase, alpha chain [Clostridia bacterium]